MKEKIGEMLMKAGMITDEQLRNALEEQKKTGDKIGSTLLKLEYVEAETLVNFLSKQFKIPPIDLNNIKVDSALVSLVDAEIANRYEVFPVKKTGKMLFLAMSNPSDIYAIEDISFSTGLDILPRIASALEIKKLLNKYYPVSKEISSIKEFEEELGDEFELVDGSFDEEEEKVDISKLEASGKSAPVIKLVNFLITDAVKRGASDIHIEPYEKLFRVRFRIDGVLQEVMAPPLRMKLAIMSRVKIMASLNISERRIPQDGRINVRVGNKVIDLRVSIIPTLYGEKVVMRILDKSSLMLDMKDLGFEEEPLRKFINAIEQPYGIVLVTGPTGSGKSTTLYSALSRLNTKEVQIITAEDPVEYNLKGINQVQINEEIGFTFAYALRAFLRQSPNIVMVGEIRDSETAEIAVRAALTGHLVLSTIHTNDAPSTINRLVDMGIPPFMVAASLNLIQAQRLVRKICAECKEAVDPEKLLLREANIDPKLLEGQKVYKGKGCAKCNQRGYKGRIAITEVLPITPGIRELILQNSPAATIREQAKKEGLDTLRDDALVKVKNGITTLEEVVRETASL
ncbi:type IV-A pilus assembly ATPase PilB [candidate division WOR-3 bacterium]|nr:type IV-A pilus assembly ATPase PilB [candidate division WOR-3 bacterium]